MAQSFSPDSYAVLIVEDDPFIMAEAVDLVEEAGFRAYTARNADQAIRHLERHSDIRVLFTDIDMPGTMDGLKLAHAVRDRWPPVTIMVVSGNVKVQQSDLPTDGVFFAKPYPPEDVLRSLAGVAKELESLASN
ncbi:response regulator transcription factor [Aureimonas jatrophae]|uniref:Response regulator receiver domain-containing protein n=1 Tax=Aureimonas jatrophae TaxID=1166073 RepID=A0A1H0DEK9_9HYPH|nr:response regulator [Aureimonas jatrophae]MBB3951846.1 CheY-like chemotaxis protein [Aureimonas jatrophae]SDN68456.1 Response regulator receiver domain-containing protein [Aureimonas jatrophae]